MKQLSKLLEVLAEISQSNEKNPKAENDQMADSKEVTKTTKLVGAENKEVITTKKRARKVSRKS